MPNYQPYTDIETRPLLKKIYRSFYRTIAQYLPDEYHTCVEIGAGHGYIRSVIPNCITTDIFPSPRISRLENAYRLSFADQSISALILFDVFHHLRYPASALKEFERVLSPGGRVILFEPCLSILGVLVYGLFHPEPLGLNKPLPWFAPSTWTPEKESATYAAQGNASRLFLTNRWKRLLPGWRVLKIKRLSAISYMLSGGYTKPRLYPDNAWPALQRLDALCDRLPFCFGTRLLVVLEKKP